MERQLDTMPDVTVSEETGITLTEAAAKKIRSIMEERGVQDQALRVFVTGGGCGGMQYGMTFDEAREGDWVSEQYGVRVVVDPVSLFYIQGSRIDYIDSLMGGGFHIENPNAVSTCGCGSSFRTARTHTGEEPPSCGY